MRILKLASAFAVLSLLLLISGSGGMHISRIELAASSHRYNLLTWEASHLPDKWIHKLNTLLPWNSQSRQEKLEDVQRFFQLGTEIGSLEQQLVELRAASSQEGTNPIAASTPDRIIEEKDLSLLLNELRGRLARLKAGVEETLESELSAFLSQQGLSSPIGLLPPVDVALAAPPRVLVVSPRDRIDRIRTLLLKPDMRVEEIEELEDNIFQELDLAALVAGLGGVATFPTIIRGNSSLRHATSLAAHEWLHTYWFFRPLGWKPWNWSREMNTLNETAATIAGNELGIMVYTAITGQKAEDSSSNGEEPAPDKSDLLGANIFDFDREMRATRLRVDHLLAQGKVEEAERYMEARRLLFLDNGVYIRKLNQAYFAFHGTYGTSPASVSPIGGEVEQLRGMADSVGDFIKKMAGFGSYQEFTEYLSRNAAEGTVSIPNGTAD